MILNFIQQYYYQFFHWYIHEKRTFNASWFIILGLSIYLPFEDFLARFIPKINIINLFLEMMPELLLYFLFLNLLKDILQGKKQWIKTPIDSLVIFFMVWSVFVLLITDTSILTGVLNIRKFIRFIFAYYVVINLNISRHKINQFLTVVVLIGVIISFVATIQYFFPPINNLFKSEMVFDKSSVPSIVYYLSKPKAGSVSGTFRNSGLLSIYLLMPLIILMTIAYYRKYKNIVPHFQYIVLIFLLIFAQFATYKRAALIICLLSPLLVLICLKRIRLFIFMLWVYTSICLLIICALLFLNIKTERIIGVEVRLSEDINPVNYISSLLSKEFVENNKRSFILRTVCGTVLSSGNWYGFGPDDEKVNEMLLKYLSDKDRNNLGDIILSGVYRDVSWCGELAYYGLPAVIAEILILLNLYRVCQFVANNSSCREYQLIGYSLQAIIIVLILYSFGEKVLYSRIFSYYLWIIAGLMMNVYFQLKSKDFPHSLHRQN